eukprot:6973470-Prorocentrum_lima.AAC.1
MTSSLVGSEMCIRDSCLAGITVPGLSRQAGHVVVVVAMRSLATLLEQKRACLLYTSDAADDMP